MWSSSAGRRGKWWTAGLLHKGHHRIGATLMLYLLTSSEDGVWGEESSWVDMLLHQRRGQKKRRELGGRTAPTAYMLTSASEETGYGEEEKTLGGGGEGVGVRRG